MAGNIKGITVEIGGDMNPLKKAIKDTNSTIKGMQKELKGVESLLKMDPTNVDLLKQKEELLGKAISENKTKLDALKAAKERADKDMANGTQVNEEEYRNLTREIASTEQKLKGLTEESKKFGSVGAQQIASYGEKLKDVGGKIESAGKAIMPASAGVLALGAAAAKTAADFDTSMSKVEAISGATGEELEALRQKAIEMGSSTNFSAKESADALTYMGMAGWKTQEMLDGLPGIMYLAGASGEELATTSDIVTDALTAFGMQASEAGHFADVLAQASSNANTDVGMMGSTFQKVAPVAGAMGYSVEDMSLAIGLMANASIKAEVAGTSLKTALANMASPTDKMAAAMNQYGISLTNSDGTMKTFREVVDNLRGSLGGLSEQEQIAAASTIFGKESMAGMLAIINASEADYNKLSDSIANCNGAAQDMYATMQDNLGGDLEALKSQLSTLAIQIGDLLVPIIRSFVTFLQGLIDKLNGMSDGQKKVIVVVGAFVAALGPLLIFIGNLITAFGTIMTLAPAITAGFTAVKAAVAAIGGPVTIVVTIIGLLIAKLIHAYATSEEFRNKVNAAFNAVKTAVTGAISAVAAKVSQFISIGRNMVEGLWNGIQNAKAWLLGKIKSWCGSILKGIKAFFGIHSPSTVMENEVGVQLPAGTANGVEKGTPVAVKAMEGMGAKIIAAAKKTKDAVKSDAVKAAEDFSKSVLTAANSWVDNKKFYNQLTLQEEVAFWEDMKKAKELKADEIAEIDKKIYTAKQSILKEENDEMEKQQKLVEDYEKSLQNRADAIASFKGIFDSVGEQEKVEGTTLIENLKGQVDLLEQWSKDMQKLAERGIGSALLDELREQGPKAAAEIHAMTQLSDGDLDKFGQLYAEKIKISTETAVNELGGLQLAVVPVVEDMAANAAYAVSGSMENQQKEEREREQLYSTIAQMFATSLLEGLNYVGNSIFDAIPKILDFYIDSTKMAKTTWDAFNGEGDRRNRYFAPSHDEIYRIALSAAHSVKGSDD